jgi:DNA-binding transcriptional MerR regulator
MAQWYVKDLSQLTGVTVQTLHDYDRIDLLKPSERLSNCYRIDSEKDLLRLQPIIALKFLGFELTQIKELLMGHFEAFEIFSVQANLLEKKAMAMMDASHALKNIIAEVADNDKSIPWETTIKIIEVYHMTQKLEHSWVKEIFTPDELKQYAAFETELKTHSTLEQKAAFEKNWFNLVAEMKDNLMNDPTSAIGIALGKKCIDWLNKVYGKKYVHLRTKNLKGALLKARVLKKQV